MFEFRALIEEARGGGGTWVQVPPSVVTGLGIAGRIPVQATFDGIPYRGSAVSMGSGGAMIIGILKDIRSKLGKKVGDEVLVTVERDEVPREVEVPEDLARALKAAGLTGVFAGLSFTRRKEIAGGVTGSKMPDTRKRRIEKAISNLGRPT